MTVGLSYSTPSIVTTVANDQTTTTETSDERTGVLAEVRRWGEALTKGTQDQRQSLEHVLVDLELASLEPLNTCQEDILADIVDFED